MKKIFIIFVFLSFFCIPAFAENNSIPSNMSKQYKTEMEQIIDSEYNQIIKNIDNQVKYAKSLRDKILQNGFNMEDYISLALIPETSIPSMDLDLYAKLLQTTQEKYLGIKYIPIGTDSVNTLDNILSPYFIDNNVDRTKLTKILLYENKQIKIIEKYIKQVENLRPVNN